MRLHVSGDNRYQLKLDGEKLCRGPERGTVDRWTYRTLDVDLTAGEHVLEAVVTLGGARLEQVKGKLLSDPGLVRCTVYFKHYLYEAYAKMGRTDLILKGLAGRFLYKNRNQPLKEGENRL